MTERDLESLKDLPVPQASAKAKRRALEHATAAFGEPFETSHDDTQGRVVPLRQTTTSDEKRSFTMRIATRPNLALAASLAALVIAAPLAFKAIHDGRQLNPDRLVVAARTEAGRPVRELQPAQEQRPGAPRGDLGWLAKPAPSPPRPESCANTLPTAIRGNLRRGRSRRRSALTAKTWHLKAPILPSRNPYRQRTASARRPLPTQQAPRPAALSHQRKPSTLPARCSAAARWPATSHPRMRRRSRSA